MAIHDSMDTTTALNELAKHAKRYSINLNECVSRDESYGLRGGGTGGTIVHPGTINLEKWRSRVGTEGDSFRNWKVAVKTPCADAPRSESTIKKFLKEVHVWSKLNHANVLPLLGITTDFNYTVSIISPWMDRGNAYRHVQDEAIDPRPLIEGIAKGMYYLHNHEPSPIFHGDLKGENVLISNNAQALLTDFGLSHIVDSTFTMTKSSTGGGIGTLRWSSPEILEGGKVSAEGDVWAFGMTALELFTRKHPFHEIPTTVGIITRVSTGRTPSRPSTEDTCARLTDKWWGICSKCWESDPTDRPTMTYVMQTITKIMNMPRAAIPNGVNG
ncbi:kinase-like domain-containing protein [Scleroderma yunnanense]